MTGSRAVHPLVTDNVFLGVLSVSDASSPPPASASWKAYGGKLPHTFHLLAKHGVMPSDAIFADVASRVLRSEIPIPECLGFLVPSAPIIAGTTALGSLLEVRPTADFAIAVERLLEIAVAVAGEQNFVVLWEAGHGPEEPMGPWG